MSLACLFPRPLSVETDGFAKCFVILTENIDPLTSRGTKSAMFEPKFAQMNNRSREPNTILLASEVTAGVPRYYIQGVKKTGG